MSVCFTCEFRAGGGDANIGCRRLFSTWIWNSSIAVPFLTSAGGRVADVQTFIFLCSVKSVSHTDHVVFCSFLWGCSPATVAEFRDDWKMWSGTHTQAKKIRKKKETVNIDQCGFLHWRSRRWSCRADKLTSRPLTAVPRSPAKMSALRLRLQRGASPRCWTQTTSKPDPSDCIGPLDPLLVTDCRRLKGPTLFPLPGSFVLVGQFSLRGKWLGQHFSLQWKRRRL